MKKIIIIIFLTLLFSTLRAIDKNAGTKGYLFLKLPVSPQIAGMGTTGEMLHYTPLTLLHHPASFNPIRGNSIAFSNTMWLVDTNMYNIAWRNVKFNHAYGLGFTYFDYGKFDKRLENGTLIGEYYPMDMRFVGNYTRQITPSLNIGGNINFLYQKIDTSSSTAISTDIGASYHLPFQNAIDIAFKNIGTSSKMDNEKTKMPIVIDFGITSFSGVVVKIKEDKTFIMPITYKLIYMEDHDHLINQIGCQIPIYDTLFLRTGYKFNYNEENFSAGFGLYYKTMSIDYAFINNKIDDIHLIGIGWEF